MSNENLEGVLVVESPEGWLVLCANCSHHRFPNDGRWQFNGDVRSPTFTPSLNECVNPPDHKHYNPRVKTSRCHFTVTAGRINYCPDCTHDLRGEHPMAAWTPSQVKLYAMQMEEHRRAEAHKAQAREGESKI